MATREDLQQLVMSLPEAAIPDAYKALDRMQTWPPQMPDVSRDAKLQWLQTKMREQSEKMRARAATSSECGISSGGGTFRGGAGWPRRGRHGFSDREAGVDCYETQILHEDVEWTVVERIRVEEAPRRLFFTIQVTGPDGVTARHEHLFDLPQN